MKRIILLGGGGHAESVVDAIEQNQEYEIGGFVSPTGMNGCVYKQYGIIGNDDDLERIHNEMGIEYAFISIGYMGRGDTRKMLYHKLKQIGYKIPCIVDKTASLALDVIVQEGAFIGKNVVLNSKSYVGEMAIINSGAIIEHSCKIGAFTHVAVGAVLCGNVEIGVSSMIGANATIIQGNKIGNHSIVGAGSVVIKDVQEYHEVVGNPARTIKELQ